MLSSILSLLAFFELVCAPDVTKWQAITTLSSGEIDVFKPYIFYAATAYCDPSQILSWSCESLCLGSLYAAALETSVLTFTTTQMSPWVTPPFNHTLLVVMGRMFSTVRDFHISKLLFATRSLKVHGTGYVEWDPTLNSVIIAHQGTYPPEM